MTSAYRQSVLDALGLIDWRPRRDRPSAQPPGEWHQPATAAASAHKQSSDSPTPTPAHVWDSAAVDQTARAPNTVDRSSAGACAGLDWAELAAWLDACDHRGASRPVFGVGNRDADVVIVGEAPGAEEDRQGEPFVGRSGRLLDLMLAEIDCSRASNVFITNICKFRPPDNRDPNPAEVEADWPVLEHQIELIEPKLVVAAGRVAAQTLLGSSQSLGKLRGRLHRYPGRELDVIVTYHPAFLLRSPQQKARAWADLCAIADRIGGWRDATEPSP